MAPADVGSEIWRRQYRITLDCSLIGGVLMAFGGSSCGRLHEWARNQRHNAVVGGSWIAVLCFFIAGIGTAMLMFRV